MVVKMSSVIQKLFIGRLLCAISARHWGSTGDYGRPPWPSGVTEWWEGWGTHRSHKNDLIPTGNDREAQGPVICVFSFYVNMAKAGNQGGVGRLGRTLTIWNERPEQGLGPVLFLKCKCVEESR